jgi:SulP family sulfate permease
MTVESNPSLKPGSNSSFTGFTTSLFTAFFIYVLEIIFVLAFTTLIYSGQLSSQIPRAMGFIILGDAILCGVVAWLSSYSGSIGVEQDTPGAMLGVLAVGIISSLSGSPAAQFATITLMIVTTTLLTGLILLGLGYFKLGGLIRFLPYPVVGGFLAGTGWLLIQGGIGIMANTSGLWDLFQPDVLLMWAPGLALGIFIYLISKRNDRPYTVPLLILLVWILFYGVTRVMGSSISDLRTAGWLLEAYSSSSTLEFPLAPSFLAQVDWSVITTHLPALIPIAFICVIQLLLGSSGMEVLIKKDIDLDRELMVAGAGNLSAGLVGGLVGFQDISFSTLNHAMSGGRRLVGFIIALLIGATIFVGTSAILYIPKFILGSVLIYLGIELLIEWVYEAWFKFSRLEFLVVVIILVVLVASGVLQAVVSGLILAVIMFAVSYSRVNVIKFTFTGREFHSRVTWAPHQQQVLDTHGNKVYILKLEGFIFFGTANSIFENLRERVGSTEAGLIKYCLLDFTKVSGIDATGMLSFSRMIQWSQEQGITLVLCGLKQNMQKQFIHESHENQEVPIQFPSSLDRGLEWCEKEIITTYVADLKTKRDIAGQLQEILGDEKAGILIPYLHPREYQPGEYLIKTGDAPDLIYYIESGRITAQLESAGTHPVRLETMSGGRTVGELGFYLGTNRTADVIVDERSVVYTLSAEDLKKMESDDPEAASIFHRMNALLLSERVLHNTRTISALERS